MKFHIKRASYDDILWILRHMRPHDRKEILATEFDDNLERIAQKYASHCDTSFVFTSADKVPIALLAGSTLWPHMMQIGFVATDEWSKIALCVSSFLFKIKDQWLDFQDIRQLFCFALSKEDSIIRWLKWLGFSEKCHLENMGKHKEDFTFLTYQRKELQ